MSPLTAVLTEMQKLPGKHHIGLDGWSSPNGISYLGVVVYFLHDGKLKSIILDFIKLTSAHTGEYLAEKVMECLKEFGLEDRVRTCSSSRAGAC